MTTERGNLFTRNDTLLGVCEGIGEELGVNPLVLRAPLAVLLLWNPAVVIATYLGAGLVLMAARFAFRAPRAPVADEPAHPAAPAAPAPTAAPIPAARDKAGDVPLPLAA